MKIFGRLLKEYPPGDDFLHIVYSLYMNTHSHLSPIDHLATLMRARHYRILAHVLFWLGYLSLVSITLSRFLPPERAIARTTVNFLFHLVLAYTHLYVLLPAFLVKRRWLVYATSLIGLIILTGIGRLAMDYLLFQALGQSMPHAQVIEPLLLSTQHISSILISGFVILIITLPVKLIEDRQHQLTVQQELENQRLEAELKFLKTQVNPHFLFNTLNNIYSLAFTGSAQTAPMVMKLSEMMRYMIYDCTASLVPLEKEVQYLQNYIELQQIKTEKQQSIKFEIQGSPAGIMIVPLLLVPLFENAFKHGNLEEIGKGWVSSCLRITPDTLEFALSNSIGANPATHPAGGIGLNNIRTRLELRYPDHYQLKIIPTSDSFQVSLHLRIV